MNIKDVLNKINAIKVIENNSGEFNKPEFDSRKISQNDLFVAVKGSVTDGHLYIKDVIEKGASVIVCEDLPENIDSKTTYIKTDCSGTSLGIIASYYYNNPSSDLNLVGITGTNGKTSIATSLYNLTRSLGYKCGLISTNKILISSKEIKTNLTTPDSLTLNSLMSDMREAGCEYCYMEVSSHAVVQKRISGLVFKGGVFTNITHDHLDYHSSFSDYLKAKKEFFDLLPKSAFALSNADDKNGQVMLQNTKADKYLYAVKNDAEFKTNVIEKHIDGTLLKIDKYELWTKFVGTFNAYNLSAIYATAKLLGFDKEKLPIALSNLEMVEGRFETIKSNNNITAIIDYAHTPDALENVLKTINELKVEGNQLTTVIGCGGNRDKLKRPIMTKIAVEFSDKVILTADNPRFEDPNEIIDDMKKGVTKSDEKKLIVIPDRKEAIRTACLIAQESDIILIAGKGHEKYQEIKGTKYDFDDKNIVCETFNQF